MISVRGYRGVVKQQFSLAMMGGETIGVPSAAGNTEKLSGLSIQQRPGNRGERTVYVTEPKKT